MGGDLQYSQKLNAIFDIDEQICWLISQYFCSFRNLKCDVENNWNAFVRKAVLNYARLIKYIELYSY